MRRAALRLNVPHMNEEILLWILVVGAPVVLLYAGWKTLSLRGPAPPEPESHRRSKRSVTAAVPERPAILGPPHEQRKDRLDGSVDRGKPQPPPA